MTLNINILIDQFAPEKAAWIVAEREATELRSRLAKAESAAADQKRYSPQQVADLYDVSRPTVYAWMESGLLDYLRIAQGAHGIRRVTPRRLQDFEARHTAAAPGRAKVNR